jgi:hypothetical protein
MASDYGLNFGFRRSDESMSTAEGRFKTPVADNALKLGTAVEINPASTGYVKVSAAAQTPVAGFHGLLVQEDSHLFDYYARDWKDSADLGLAKKNTLCIIRGGAGTKVWLKNTAETTSGDGTVTAAVAMFTQGSIAVGDTLTWNGTLWVEATPGTAEWMKVTHVETDFLEAVLVF